MLPPRREPQAEVAVRSHHDKSDQAMTNSINRRSALGTMAGGFGSLAFAAMATEQALAADSKNPLAPKPTHFPARAKHVIMLFMSGAPSHVDTFDYKPQLQKDGGKESGGRASKLMASPWEFSQHGESGLWISSLLPHISRHADDLCLLRGMHTDQPNHAAARQAAHTGTAQFIRPSLGAWSVYGLGTENTDLPGYVALGQAKGPDFGSAFLPAVYQATGVKTGVESRRRPPGAPGMERPPQASGPTSAVPNIKNPVIDLPTQQAQLEFLQQLNRGKLSREQSQPQVEGIIQSYELAFRMQSTMPELVDLSGETEATKAMYGIGNGPGSAFGTQCLMARRMVEAGVRFIELTNGNWDQHNNIEEGLQTQCGQVDQPIAGLLADLKQRDLLEDTLVIWAGEFGRTPHGENGSGRGHNNKGYTTLMAGGGVKGGFSYGATDQYGYEAIEGRMHTHDWHATILHLLGLDHEKLTYRHAGRPFRLTNVAGTVAKDILA